MSVILTACRHSKQKALARALKKRAEKQKLKTETELQQLESDDVDNFFKMWCFLLDGEPSTVTLLLASDKDTVDILYNDIEVTDVMTNCTQDGATFDFVVGCSHKARISCCGNPFDGLTHEFTVDGFPVPEYSSTL